MFRKKAAPSKNYDPKVVTRVKGMEMPELYRWCESTLQRLQVDLDAIRYRDAPFTEFSAGLDALGALWNEVQERDS